MRKTQALRLLSFVGAAALAGSAHAQSGITIYGYLDLAVVKESEQPVRLERGNNNLLGFKGSEDLGGGLSAIFNLQTRMKTDTGENERGIFWQGESTVGLASDTWGRLRLGRALSPLWQQKWPFDPWYDSGMLGSVGAYTSGRYATDGSGAFGFANFARMPNSVFYDTPSFGGFAVHAATQIEKEAGMPDRIGSLAATYRSGPVKTLLAYERNSAEDSIWLLGASYEIAQWTLMGTLAQDRSEAMDDKERNVELGVAYTAGVHMLRFGVGRNQDTRAQKFAAGYNHALSKRTNLYADLYREKIVDHVNGFAAGINHSF